MESLKKVRNFLLDIFFISPIIFDLLFAIFIIAVSYFLKQHSLLKIDNDTKFDQIAFQIGTSCITIAGFILTILTIVVTFKSIEESKQKSKAVESEEEINKARNSKIQLFFTSDLYFKTVKVLQQSVSVLVLLFAILILTVIFDKSISNDNKFFLNIGCLSITILIVLRCILTLKLIIRLQIGNKSENN